MHTPNYFKFPFKSVLPFITLPISVSALAAPADVPDIQPGTVIYKVNADIPANDLKALNALLHSQGLVSEKTLKGSQITIATFAQKGRETAIANILKHSSYVEFAEPDYAVSPTLEPNDNLYNSQWHHAAVNTPQSWDVTTGSNNVLVAVCDTGFEVTHPDLSANLRTDLAYNAQDGSSYIYDANGHGTGTAGTLGAVGNNATGVAGINWNVDIIPVRIAISDTNSSAYISTMATCIEYAADNGARVVNLSYGGIEYATIDSAAQYLRSKNGLLFMSAGNDYQEFPDFPDYTSFIGVGATNESNTRASFSNWGTYVDITAPGTSILTTYPGSNYVYYSGTSFSSPLAAGVAALMVAANPGITVEELENGLFSTATDIGANGDDNVYGHGLVNAQAAVNYALNIDSLSAPVAVINANSNSVPYGVEVALDAIDSYDPDGSIDSYYWNLGDGTYSELVDVTHTYSAAGSYQVSLTVTDNDGLSHSATTIIQVTTDIPTAVIDTMATSYNIGDLISFNGTGSTDTDGTITAYNWDFGDNSEPAVGESVNYAYTTAGSYTVTLTVTDNAGAQNSTSIEINITDPDAVNAPTGLQASAVGLEVSLSWQDNNASEENFIVQRGVKYRGKTTFTDIATLNANTTSYVDTVPEAGEYSYQIKAKNSANEATSEIVKITVDAVSAPDPEPSPDPDPGVLSAPSNLVALINGNNVELSWTYDASEHSGFYIERGEKVRGQITYTRLAEVGSGTTSYQDNGLSAGTYSYRVQAFSSNNEVSDYSNSTEARLK